jgi:hypothetical protein
MAKATGVASFSNFDETAMGRSLFGSLNHGKAGTT